MKHLWLLLLFPVVMTLPAMSQDIYACYNGSSQQGGQTITVNGIQSLQKVQQSYPSATVTVFNHGTITPASPIFQDAAGVTPLANPFTASSTGVAFFCTADGRYDIQYTGTAPNGTNVSVPFTVTVPDISLCFTCTGGGGGGGSNVLINGISQSTANFNSTSPAADAGFTPVTWGVLGNSVRGEIPTLPSAFFYSNPPIFNIGFQNGTPQTSPAISILDQPNGGMGLYGPVTVFNRLYSGIAIDLTVGALETEISNCNITGTTPNKLVKLNGGCAIITGISDVAGILGVADTTAGTVAAVTIVQTGQINCIFDGPTTAGDQVVNSTTIAGDCEDTGSPSPPSASQAIGRVLTTNGGAGTYAILATAGATSGSGGGGTVTGSGTTGTIPVWISSTGIGNSLLAQSGSIVNHSGTQLVFTNATSPAIKTSTVTGAGGNLSIIGANNNATFSGGSIAVTAGSANLGQNAGGGNITLTAGANDATSTSLAGGAVTIAGGQSNNSGANAGSVTIAGGAGTTAATGGTISLNPDADLFGLVKVASDANGPYVEWDGLGSGNTTSQIRQGAGVPAMNCPVGSVYQNTHAASASTTFYVCQPANTWTALGVGGGGTITGATTNGGLSVTGTTLNLLLTCSNGQVLEWNGSAWVCTTPTGTGNTTSATGTVNTLTKYTGANTIGNSLWTDTGTLTTYTGTAGALINSGGVSSILGIGDSSTNCPVAGLTSGTAYICSGSFLPLWITDNASVITTNPFDMASINGIANGLATLDGTANVPAAQLLNFPAAWFLNSTNTSLSITPSQSTWTIADYGASTLPTNTAMLHIDNATTSTDNSTNVAFDTGTSSSHEAFAARIRGTNQLQICEQPGPQGEAVFGSAVTCPNIYTTTFAKNIFQSSTATHTLARFWQSSAAFTGDFMQFNTATTGSGFNLFTLYTGVAGTDTFHTGGSLVAKLDGSGFLTVSGCSGCGSGTPGGSTDALQYNNGGAFAGLNSPTTNGTYQVIYNVTGSAAVAPTAVQGGVNVDPQTGNYSLACPLDRLGEVEFNITSAATLTVAQAGSTTCLQGNYAFVVRNTPSSTAVLTITATTSTFQPEGGSSHTILPGGSLFIYSDATTSTGNYHAVDVPASFGGVNVQTSNYTLTAADRNKLLVMNCSGACVTTLPAAPPNSAWDAWVMSIGGTLATVSLNSLNFNGAGTPPTLTTGHAIQIRTDASNYYGDISSAGGGGTPCVTTALSLQYDNAGAFGCVPDVTFSTPHTMLFGGSGILDLSATAPTAGLKLPSAAGAVPTADGFIGVNTTNHTLVSGSNGTTIVQAAAATGTNTSTACSANNWVSTISAIAAPTCTQPGISNLSSSTSAQLAAVLNDETGTSLAVFNTSPLLVTPKVTTITDANANPFILSSATASAVDSITVTNAATANPATVVVGGTGSDANINLELIPKGTGKLLLGSTNATMDTSGNLVVVGCTGCSGPASVQLSSITAAAGSNTIANGDNPQIWNWATTTSGRSAFTFGETTASTSAGTPFLVNIQTLASSTANPLVVTAVGTSNGLEVTKAAVIEAIGSGAFAIGGTAHGVLMSQGATTAVTASAVGTSGQPFLSGGSGADGAYGNLSLAGTGVTGLLPISSVGSATGAIATIADGNNPLTINCALTSGTSCLTLGETTASSTSGSAEAQITTLTTTTSIPLQITQGAAGPANSAAPNIIKISAAAAGGASGASNAGSIGAAISLLTGNGSAGGATTGNGGAGGGFSITEGNGGAGGGNTANNGGAGGGVTWTTGNGGNAAATGTSGNGGDLVLTTGVGGTTGTTVGRNGQFNITSTAPASVSVSAGIPTGTIFNITGVAGGASSNAAGTGGIGSVVSINSGTGGAGTGTNAVGGAGGGLNFATGAGGASLGTGANANGGNETHTMGIAGVGGSGTAGTTGQFTVTGTAPASSSTVNGLTIGNLFDVLGVTGGATSNAAGTAGTGSNAVINSGTGGAGTGTNAVGGAGGAISLTAGAGGASLGTGANANGGSIVVTPGAAGTGGSGTAGKQGVLSVAGTGAGFTYLTQGAAVTTANTNIPANSIIDQAPTSVTAYATTRPGTAASGTLINNNASSVITQGYSGDSNHSATVTTGSGTSIGLTSLCSTTFCPAGTYRVNFYIDVTTACGTSGTYTLLLTWTDDQGSKSAFTVPIAGTGTAAGILTTTSTANWGQATMIIRSTGAAAIQYSTTAVACGTAGPMVGKLYMSVEPVQ